MSVSLQPHFGDTTGGIRAWSIPGCQGHPWTLIPAFPLPPHLDQPPQGAPSPCPCHQLCPKWQPQRPVARPRKIPAPLGSSMVLQLDKFEVPGALPGDREGSPPWLLIPGHLCSVLSPRGAEAGVEIDPSKFSWALLQPGTTARAWRRGGTGAPGLGSPQTLGNVGVSLGFPPWKLLRAPPGGDSLWKSFSPWDVSSREGEH